MTDREYAFEVKLWAVVRVKSQDEEQARQSLNEIVDRIEVPGSLDVPSVTEVTLSTGVDDAFLFEVDGVDTTDE